MAMVCSSSLRACSTTSLRARSSGSTDIREISFSFRGGADLAAGNWNIGPRAVLTYTNAETDTYVETGSRTEQFGALERRHCRPAHTGRANRPRAAYDEQSRRSILFETGAEVAYRVVTPFGAVIPHFSGYWRHEFDDDLQLVTVRMAQDLRPTPKRFTFATDGPDADTMLFAMLFGFGASAIVGEHLAARFEFSQLAYDDLYDSSVITIQARWRF